jgi:aminoglycoside 2''-phosphotransferase
VLLGDGFGIRLGLVYSGGAMQRESDAVWERETRAVWSVAGAERGGMTRQQSYLKAIRKTYPDLQVSSVVYHADGQNNDVLILNGSLIFRFPRYEQGLRRLRSEVAILAGIRSAVTLVVPEPIFVHLEGATLGEAFLGYEMIAGEPLWRETMAAIQNSRTLDRLAGQLGTFLRELHAVPVETTIGITLPVSSAYAQYSDLYARIQYKLFPYMRPDARAWAFDHFEAFLGDPRSLMHTPVLIHGDFGTSNILVDPATQSITGIIDFGSAGLGDPASDLAGLLSQYGDAFVRRLARAYPDLDACWHRMVFYQGTFALQEALSGLENDDPQALAHGLARYV